MTKRPPIAAAERVRSGRAPDQAAALALAVRADPAARSVVTKWRSLTSVGRLTGRAAIDRRTLVAVSGGADSVALLLALRGATPDLAVGHVVHYLRTPEEERADRDFVRDLARSLGAGFLEREIHPPARGNMEAEARRLRYAALTDMARAAQAGFVATAHHADDQTESVLLALVRGAGPEGLSGVAPRRTLADGVTLIRPMLGATRADAQRICAAAGVAWREDRTNTDEHRARAAIRRRVTPTLEALRPGASLRAARAAEMLRDAHGVIADRAALVFGEGNEWARAALRLERVIVIGAGLRTAIRRAAPIAGADRLTTRSIDPVVRAIRDDSTEPRDFTFGSGAARVVVRVRSRTVSIEPQSGSPTP